MSVPAWARDDEQGCGADHPHIDVTCNHHAGDGRHRYIDEWGTLDSWPIEREEPKRPPVGLVPLVLIGTLLAAAVAIVGFMSVASAMAVS